MVSLVELERTAVDACLAGGRYLRDAHRSGQTDADLGAHDVKSSADTGAEEQVLAVVQGAFPGHHHYAEESGVHAGDETYRWIIDPLDGTNNFESGLPTFATAITVLVEGDPAVGVVYAPLLDDLYVGRRDAGVRYDGRPVSAETAARLSQATVVSVIGHDVKRDPDHHAVSKRLNRGVEERCKRRLESWCPTVHWGLLARGRLDGVVCYRPDREEQRLGELFARESGMCVETGDDWFVAGGNEAVADELAALVTATC